ncbi:Di-copper centre-containing protein [Lophiostoma macrostomum CBS 122681]|uniref:tyrosinase n=1 Tax=Lophiostoma macrostomum CBS 122681 TaxID=1314788 RepID=A0A6A6SVM2_9PLEO|nr:Di-copper centre-containing protein [Lophiostoma macrostomum CBS 122681]
MKCSISLAALASLLSFFGASAGQNLTNGANSTSCSFATQDDGSYYSVVGIQGTGVHPRMELRKLEKNAEMWNLFIQAFAAFQAMDQNDKLSYYSISGIHGAPFTTWDNVNGTGAKTGYCPHESNVFSTWHRPYLALVEQILHERAIEIANSFPEGESRRTYQETAKKLRIPYWDWAMDPPDSAEGCMPASLRRTTATVTLPNGTVSEIPNPLYQYKFHPRKPDDWTLLTEAGYPFYAWDTTVRSPPQGYVNNATSDNDVANQIFTKQQASNRDMLYKLLTVYQPFNEWSNNANGGKIGSIETLHDGIHNSFGGNMGIVMASAFDPVFYFHHINVDRLIAIYQKRYPDTFVEAAKLAKATYVWATDSTIDTTTPLAPFHMNADGDMWTSTTVRNWKSFGYTYPELEGNPSNESLTLQINRLYKPATNGLVNSTVGSPMARSRNGTNATTDALDWYCEVNMPSDIQMSYSVRAFLGAPSNNSKDWPLDPNYVGQVASLAGPQAKSNVTITANIGLTQKLMDKFKAGELKSLEKSVVQEYLEREFYWRVQRVDLTQISHSELPAGLNVTLMSVPVHLPDSELEVPVWTGVFDYHHNITGNPPAAAISNTSTILSSAQASIETAVVSGLASSASTSVYTASEPGGIAGTSRVRASSNRAVSTRRGTATAALSTVTDAPDAPNQTTIVEVVNGSTRTRVETEIVYVTMTVAG